MGAVLLTGATGFVGREVLSRFLARGDRDVYALVRADDDTDAAGRLPGHERLTAVAGDIERSGLGLSEETAGRLRGEVSTVVHCAASVSFDLPLEESRRVNVGRHPPHGRVRARLPGARAVHLRLHRVRGRRAGRPVPRGRARRGPELPQPVRAVEVRGRGGAARGGGRPAAPDPAAEHRGGRQHHRPHHVLQRALRAAQGVRPRRDARDPGAPRLAGGHRAGRLRGRPCARARHGRAGRDLPPGGGAERDDRGPPARAVVERAGAPEAGRPAAAPVQALAPSAPAPAQPAPPEDGGLLPVLLDARALRRPPPRARGRGSSATSTGWSATPSGHAGAGG